MSKALARLPQIAEPHVSCGLVMRVRAIIGFAA